MISILLIGAIAFLLYIYLGYPMGMRVAARLSSKKNDTLPRSAVPDLRVSVIAAAYNEEAVLSNCLEALTHLTYPKEKIEFLIGSDGSTDGTNLIGARHERENSNFKFFPFELRRGKIPVLNDLVELAKGDILFFVDADVEIDTDALLHHLSHYPDEEVGGVAGSMKYVYSGGSQTLISERGYQSFDEKLKQAESDLGSTIGLFGANYSMRRSLWKKLPSSFVHDDFFELLTILDAKKRIRFEPRAVAIEHYARSGRDEFKRKARFASRGLYTLSFFSGLLSPSQGRIALMLWSHKILRWFTPYLLLVLFLSTIAEVAFTNSTPAILLLIFECFGIVAALIGKLLERSRVSIPLVQHAWWFMLMNVAFAVGVCRYLFGVDRRLWAESTRPSHSQRLTKEGQAL